MKKLLNLLLFVAVLGLWSCQNEPEQKITADLILTNGNVYTVNDTRRANAIAIKGDKILDVGSITAIDAFKSDSTEVIDLEGRFVMPGFIEGHGHYSGLGASLLNLNFLKTNSWEEIVAMVEERVKNAEPGEWIIGRGWHQEKWEKTPDRNVLGYPYHNELSAVSPNNPVFLNHASGHAAFANAKAMELAGITAETPDPFGGEIIRDSRGEPIGVFEETAENLINSAYKEYRATLSAEAREREWYKGIEMAEQECLENGITSFQDAGSSFREIEKYKEMAESGELDTRLWVMITGRQDNLAEKAADYPQIGIGNNYLAVRAIKGYMDGALGARGAWLLEPYNDKPDSYGKNTTPIEDLISWGKIAYDNGLQYCVHGIGDRGNREILNIFENQFQEDPSKIGLRWRIEHAQHLDTSDIPRFKELGVIASIQGIHCTSDAPFVVARLGRKRARYGAYPWRSLLDNGVIIANGTDAPVEDVSPIESFYASVTRRRPDNGMVFFPEQKMTREEAILSYTLGNAYAAFEENIKGSLEKGKLADIVVLSNDLLTCKDEDILQTDILMTIIGGEIKHSKL